MGVPGPPPGLPPPSGGTDEGQSQSQEVGGPISDNNGMILLQAITHLFLPKKTPEAEQPDLGSIEQFILQSVKKSVAQVIQESPFSDDLEGLPKMLELWELLQPNPNSPERVIEEKQFVENFRKWVSKSSESSGDGIKLKPLTTPPTIPVYIRKQNCTVLVERKEDGSMQLETFRAALPSELVMSSVGPLAMDFPETRDVVQNEGLLTSMVFARSLYQLAIDEIGISTPVQEKCGMVLANLRDVPEPFLISDWIVTVLSPTERVKAGPELDTICKKIRDQVTLSPVNNSSDLIPFRRSGLWMSIKVAVQLKLLKLFGDGYDPGVSKVIYKLLILRVLADLCKKYYEMRDIIKIDFDLAAQMQAKIGGRVMKLEKLFLDLDREDEDMSNSLDFLKTEILEYVELVVGNLHRLMKSYQAMMIAEDGDMNGVDDSANNNPARSPLLELPPHSHKSFLKDLNHSIPFLNSYKDEPSPQKQNGLARDDNITEDLQESLELQRYVTIDAILSGAGSLSEHYSTNERIWLHDAETFMKKYLWTEPHSWKIRHLVQTYVKHGLILYERNPVGISQMILAVLKAVEALDMMATQTYPLILDYLPGITSSSFDCLVLPHKDDMKLLDETLAYFQGRHSHAKKHSGIITEKVTAKSFAVTFASQDPKMIELKNGILTKTEEWIANRQEKINEARTECNQILQKILEAPPQCFCTFTSTQETRKDGTTRAKSLCTQQCNKCKMEYKVTKLRSQFTLIERPLPNEEQYQKAVVFEALIPQLISDLRDCLAILKFGLLDEPVFDVAQNEIAIEWMGYGNLVKFYLPEGLPGPETGRVIRLGSKRLNTWATCYRNTKTDILTWKDEDLVVDNGLQCIYGYLFTEESRGPRSKLKPMKETPIPPITFLRKHCSFQITDMDNSTPYLPLQGYLQSCSHCQNEVIANQSSCNANLALDEFITFGSIRAGHRIQLRNLYRAIASKVVSLEEEPVLALILQTIWEIGPSDSETGERDTHLDFEEDGFSTAMLNLLEDQLHANETNYSQPLKLIAAVAITVRILELNESMYGRCYSLLKNWRSMMRNWTRKIEVEMSQINDPSGLGELKKNLLLIRICSALSYNFSGYLKWDQVMKGYEDIVEWLHTITSLNQIDQDEPLSASSTSLSKFMQILLNVGRNVALQLQLEVDVMDNPMLRESLRLFVTEKWSRATEFNPPTLNLVSRAHKNLVQVTFLKRSLSAIEDDYQVFRITFDFILGSFLVNGFPQGYLPVYVSRSKIFQRFFRQNVHLRVQRESPVAFSTIGKFQGKRYEFRVYPKSSNDENEGDDSHKLTVIKEICDDGTSRTLLDHQMFTGLFAPSLVKNYTHWLCQDKSVVYLRRIPNRDSDYDRPPEYKLLKKIEKPGKAPTWLLHDEVNQLYLLSIKSPGFEEVTEALIRLELNEHINVLLDMKTKVVSAHLPRHNLRFFINPESNLEILEYPGFCLTTGSGKIQTLIGLQHGVQLKSKSKQVVLLPNGSIRAESAETEYYFHHRTLIELEELRQPTYFIYEFDQILNRVVAKKSKQAWFYLAALNAVTSSPLPDPFTGVTGTEMAVRILQSGFSWSSSPYDEDSLRILKFIRGLAPKRTYYQQRISRNKDQAEEEDQGQDVGLQEEKGAMEVIEWEDGLPSMAAYDGFAIIVDKLIEDSERLGPLYYVDKEKTSAGQTNTASSTTLRMRSYFRHLSCYNQAAHIKQDYFRSSLLLDLLNMEDKKVQVKYTNAPDSFQLDSVVHIASRRLPQYSRAKSEALHKMQNKKKKKNKDNSAHNNLLNFLFSEYKPYFDGSPNSMKDIFNLDFRTNWLHFYGMAMQRGQSPEIKHLFTLLLSAMAYQEAPIAQILNLHYISAFAEDVDFPPQLPFPVHSGHQLPLVDPSESTVEEMFMEILSSSVDIPTVNIEMGLSWPNYLEKFEGSIRNVAMHLTSSTLTSRAREGVGMNANVFDLQFDPSYVPCIDYELAMSKINNLLFQWHWTKQLKRFAKEVQNRLNEVQNRLNHPIPEKEGSDSPASRFGLVTSGELEWAEEVELWELLETDKLNQELWKAADKCFTTGRSITKISKSKNKHLDLNGVVLISEGIAQSFVVEEIMKNLTAMIGGSLEIKIMCLAGMCPRMDPTSLLSCLAQKEDGDIEDDDMGGENIAKIYTGALAVLWTQMKRINRCLTYQTHQQFQERELELANTGHENWSPKEHPEWLLLELDLDIMIRPIQVEVAKQMMEMPGGGGNGVMQMNMGEGKTSVIVPMLCSALGKKDEELLCRVTVLPPMFSMNYGILSFAVGGLLNRRIYTIPCRRDMAIDIGCLDMIQTAYKECLEMRGVVLTLPEHRLSFRLLACDTILKKNVGLGMELLKTENWLREHVRDVLDESDELLNVKYQLVYTVGEQIAMDGGELRWLTCQRLLKIVQDVGVKFLGKYGQGIVEFNKDEFEQNPHQFAPIRLLDGRIFPQFISTVADVFLEGLLFSKEDKLRIKQFLTQENIKNNRLDATLDLVKDVSGLLPKILLISGYLRRGVLTLGLSKRWRVEYGVDVTKTFRRMAVPFRAKDVPAERTEFGHPDLAILLTQLSYYYSGLDDPQLVEVIKILGSKQGAETIYGSWIHQIPQGQVPEYLSTFHGLNLKDAFQKSKLFELLRRHKMVVDFWLSNKVFPKESKQFPAKLVMTAWDLCYERGEYPVTGFSGTNDSSILLPPQIPQNDLASLGDTNGKVEAALLKPENQGHRRLEMGVNCAQILGLMKKDKLTVLIDAGALMLECNNEEVANLWLELDQDAEAVLYFNQGNELKVMCRSARGQTENPSIPFELSSYQGRLNKCRVFLDDQHTRGTDLKFVEGTRACVTVGGNMKRDKLIQACMRMRKLGSGHSVTFYLSHEAHDKIKQGPKGDIGDAIDTGLVLEWVFRNTQSFNEDGLLYWAIAGRNYAQRLIAEDNFYSPQSYKNFQMDGDEEEDLGGGDDLRLETKANTLAQQYMDVEVTTLMDSYGQHIQSNLLVKEIPKWFEGTWNQIKSKNDNRKLPADARKTFERIQNLVLERCEQQVPNKTHFSGSHMEEQQEREMEKETEVEEERINEKRGKAKPVKPNLHHNVTRVVVHGDTIQIKEGIMRLCDVFKDTEFWEEVQPEGWGNEVFATTDFISVIEDKYAKTDMFIRPIEYLVSLKDGPSGKTQLLVLSPYEVNELMENFRNGEAATNLHMFSLRRSAKQDLLLNEAKLMLPRGVPLGKIPESSSQAAALLLASGNLYFRSMEEQLNFVRFLCLAPQPWTKEEERAFANRLITKTGFMTPAYRREKNIHGQGFNEDTTDLLRMILMCRHPILSEMAHVAQLLNERRYAVIPGGDRVVGNWVKM